MIEGKKRKRVMGGESTPDIMKSKKSKRKSLEQKTAESFECKVPKTDELFDEVLPEKTKATFKEMQEKCMDDVVECKSNEAVKVVSEDHKNHIRELILCIQSEIWSLEKLGDKKTPEQEIHFHHLNIYFFAVQSHIVASGYDGLQIDTACKENDLQYSGEKSKQDQLVESFKVLFENPHIKQLFLAHDHSADLVTEAVRLSCSQLEEISLKNGSSDMKTSLKWYSDKISLWVHGKADGDTLLPSVKQGIIAALSHEILILACKHLTAIVSNQDPEEVNFASSFEGCIASGSIDESQAIQILVEAAQLLSQSPILPHTLPFNFIQNLGTLSNTMTRLAGPLTDILVKAPAYTTAVSKEVFTHHLNYIKSACDSQKLVIVLLQYSPACQQWFKEWVQHHNKQLKKDDMKLVYLPVFKELLSQGVDSGVLENICKHYWEFLCRWITCKSHSEDDQSNATFEDKLHMLQELIRHTSDKEGLQDLLNQLLATTKTEDLPSSQISLAQFKVLKTVFETSTFSSDHAAFFSACVQGLLRRLSHKSQRCQEVEVFLINCLLETCKSLSSDVSVCQGLPWKQLITTGLKHHFKTREYLLLLAKLIPFVYKGDCSVDSIDVCQLHQMLLGHSAFLPVTFDKDLSETRDALLDLQIALIDQDSSCCQTQHISFLLGAYGASCSKTDKNILLLLQKYESSKCVLASYKPYLWGEKAIEHYSLRKSAEQQLSKAPTSKQVMELLDKGKMLQSALAIPLNKNVQQHKEHDNSQSENHYDIDFLLPLFSHLLATENLVDCRQFVETNSLGFTFAALSCHSESVRGAAYHILANFYQHVEGARGFAEKHQVLYLLNAVRSSIETENAKLPCIITVFLAKAAALMLQPEEHMYQMVNSFLLLKPSLDLGNVPEFYKLFNSAAMEYREERTWLLKLLLEGLRETQDYHIFEKRYTFKLMLSFHDSPLSDKPTRALIMKIVQRACSIKSVASDLSKNHAILPWLKGVIQAHGGDRHTLPSLVGICHTLWCTMLDGRDSEGQKGAKSPCLPVLFTNQMMLTVLQLLQAAKRFQTLDSFLLLIECLVSICGHADKTEKHMSTGSGYSVMPVRLTDRDLLHAFWHWAVLTQDKTLQLELTALLGPNQDMQLENHVQNVKNKETVVERCEGKLHDLVTYWRPPVASLATSACTFVTVARWSLHSIHKTRQIAGLSQILPWLESWILNEVQMQDVLLADASQSLAHGLLTASGLLPLTPDPSDLLNGTTPIKTLNKILLSIVQRALQTTTVNSHAIATIHQHMEKASFKKTLAVLQTDEDCGLGIGVSRDCALSIVLQELWIGARQPTQNLVV